jgi:hypothetical protein
MSTKLLAIIFRWIARVIGIVLVGLVMLIAIGEGVPNLFTQPVVIQIGFLALALILLGFLLAWRWEIVGGSMSLAGWFLFIAAERINWRHSSFFVLLAVPGLLFLSSSFLHWHYEKHKSA